MTLDQIPEPEANRIIEEAKTAFPMPNKIGFELFNRAVQNRNGYIAGAATEYNRAQEKIALLEGQLKIREENQMSIICTCGKASGPMCNGADGCPWNKEEKAKTIEVDSIKKDLEDHRKNISEAANLLQQAVDKIYDLVAENSELKKSYALLKGDLDRERAKVAQANETLIKRLDRIQILEAELQKRPKFVNAANRLPALGVQALAFEQEAPILRGTLERSTTELGTVHFKFRGGTRCLNEKAEYLKEIWWLEETPLQ